MEAKEKLGTAVATRRVQLGMRTAKQLAEASGLSARLISDVESGRRNSYAEASLTALDQALQWPEGNAQHLLDTGTPLGEQVRERVKISRDSNHIERWRTVETNGKNYLQVTAEYDPQDVNAENLERIAVNARHYMHKEFDDLMIRRLTVEKYTEPTNVEQLPAPSFDEMRSAAFRSDRHGFDKYGDEDEQTQIDP